MRKTIDSLQSDNYGERPTLRLLRGEAPWAEKMARDFDYHFVDARCPLNLDFWVMTAGALVFACDGTWYVLAMALWAGSDWARGRF